MDRTSFNDNIIIIIVADNVIVTAFDVIVFQSNGRVSRSSQRNEGRSKRRDVYRHLSILSTSSSCDMIIFTYWSVLINQSISLSNTLSDSISTIVHFRFILP